MAVERKLLWIFSILALAGAGCSRREKPRAPGVPVTLKLPSMSLAAGETLGTFAAGLRIEQGGKVLWQGSLRSNPDIAVEVVAGIPVKAKAYYVGFGIPEGKSFADLCPGEKNEGPSVTPPPTGSPAPGSSSGGGHDGPPNVYISEVSTEAIPTDSLTISFPVAKLATFVPMGLTIRSASGAPAAGASLTLLDWLSGAPLDTACPAESLLERADEAGQVSTDFPLFRLDSRFSVAVTHAGMQKPFDIPLSSTNLGQNLFVLDMASGAIAPSPATADFDKDGVSNADELAAGTSPYTFVRPSDFHVDVNTSSGYPTFQVWPHFDVRTLTCSISGATPVDCRSSFCYKPSGTCTNPPEKSIVVTGVDSFGFRIPPLTLTSENRGPGFSLYERHPEGTGVSPNANILVGVNGTVDTTSLTGRFILARKSAPATPIACSIFSLPNGRIGCTPDSEFAANTEYQVTLQAGVRTTSGATLDQPEIWSFTTAAPNPAPPMLAHAWPQTRDGRPVARTGEIGFKFSKPVALKGLEGLPLVKLVRKSDGVEVTVDCSVRESTWSGGATEIGCRPVNANDVNRSPIPLEPMTRYQARFLPTARDTGNRAASGVFLQEFVTAGSNPGTFSRGRTFPEHDATGVNPEVVFGAEFSQPLAPMPWNGVTLTSSQGSIPVKNCFTDKTLLLCKADAPLASGIKYTATLTGIEDIHGRTLSASSWSFTIGSATSFQHLGWITLGETLAGVPATAEVTTYALFNRPVDTSTLGWTTSWSGGSCPNWQNKSSSCRDGTHLGGHVLARSVLPTTAATSVSHSMSSSIKSNEGSLLNASPSRSLTLKPVPLAVVASSPQHGEMVNPHAPLKIWLNQPIGMGLTAEDLKTHLADNVKLRREGVLVPCSWQYEFAEGSPSIWCLPGSGLSTAASYTLSISNVASGPLTDLSFSVSFDVDSPTSSISVRSVWPQGVVQDTTTDPAFSIEVDKRLPALGSVSACIPGSSCTTCSNVQESRRSTGWVYRYGSCTSALQANTEYNVTWNPTATGATEISWWVRTSGSFSSDGFSVQAPFEGRSSPLSPSNSSTSPFISGLATAGSVVTVYSNFECTSTVTSTTATDGTFMVSTSVSSNSTTSFYAKATLNGSTSPCVPLLDYTHDNTPPTLTATMSGPSTVGASGSVTFTIAASEAVVFALTPQQVAQSPANSCDVSTTSGQGAPTVTLSGCGGSGNVSVSLVAGAATDAAGNTSVATFLESFIVDTTAPSVYITSPSQNPHLTDQSSVVLMGTCSTDVTTLTISSPAVLTDSDCSDNNWSATISGLDLTRRTPTVTATDAAGNTASATKIIDRQIIAGLANPNDAPRRAMITGEHHVWSDGTRLAIVDTECHRVFLYNSLPADGVANPDVVLGQQNAALCNTFPPDSSTLHLPRGVHFDGTNLYVADTGNNRVLVWNGWPAGMAPSASVVLGQPDLTSNAANNGGISGSSLKAPQAVVTSGSKLIVADTGNNRVLIWNTIPNATGATADVVVGQSDFSANSCTRPIASNTLCGPTGLAPAASALLVADNGNARVLRFGSIPSTSGANATNVIGQSLFSAISPIPSDATLLSARAVHYTGSKLLVADEKANRVLVWNTLPGTNGAAADYVLGQSSMTNGLPNSQGATAASLFSPTSLGSYPGAVLVADSGNGRALRFSSSSIISNGVTAMGLWGRASTPVVTSTPVGTWLPGGFVAGMARLGQKFAVADPVGNRVLLWNNAPTSPIDRPDIVLGQNDFASTALNQGSSPTAATLSDPSSVALVGDGTNAGSKLLVADRGNNRVLIWNSWPSTSGQGADLVLGQASMASNTTGQLNGPTSVWSDGVRILVANALGHQVAGWATWPASYGQSSTFNLGSGTAGCSAVSLDGPSGVWSDGTRIFIADRQNKRVVGWSAWPSGSVPPADIVLGAADLNSCSAAFDPSGISGAAGRLLVSNDYPTSQQIMSWNLANLPAGSTPIGPTQLNTALLAWGENGTTRLYVASKERTWVWNQIPLNGEAASAEILGFGAQHDQRIMPGDLVGARHAIVVNGKLVVADTGNNRVLIWNSVPHIHGLVPDVVLGQSNSAGNLPNGGRAHPDNQGLWKPTAVASDGTNLVVADTGNNRVLIWNGIPTESNAAAQVVLGQPDFHSAAHNAGAVSGLTLSLPRAVRIAFGRLFVADTGNNRVLIWNGVPTGSSTAPDVVVGQSDFHTRFASAAGLNSPSWMDVDPSTGKMAIADLGNYRVLVWSQVPTSNGALPSSVLGQPSFSSTGYFNYTEGDSRNLMYPWSVSFANGRLFVGANTGMTIFWQLSNVANDAYPTGVLGRSSSSDPVPSPSLTGMVPNGVPGEFEEISVIPDADYSRVILSTRPLGE